jgi:uncharacterized membrane protein
MTNWKALVEGVGQAMDVGGVVVIVVGVVVATVVFAMRTARRQEHRSTYRSYRQAVGRAILLGLEILVAADIIRTVAASPTFQSVGVLAIIVAIRTFLSMSLQLELEGRWPWQRPATDVRSAS